MRWLLVPVLLTLALAGFGYSLRGHGNRPAASGPPRVTRRVHAAKPPRLRPPQFVVVSFDGAGGERLWGYWRAVARRADAHFTFFLSGVYLLDWAHSRAYAPPRTARGTSAIGFAPDRAWADATVRQVARGYREGHEIGTHFNGHFCGAGGVGTWTAADWGHELDEFDRLVRRARLPFVVGARTPCLEGNLAALDPVLARRGYRYDASRVAPLGTWPQRLLGLWSIPLPEVPFVGHTFRVVGMDYNLMANQTGEPVARVESETYRTYVNAFRASYLGDRAPLSLGNHFEGWNSWAYDHALARLLLDVCRRPEVRCVSFRELADWLDRQPPARLARYRAGRFPQATAHALDRR